MTRQTFGLSAALTAAYGADGSVDAARMSKHAAWCLRSGCDSVTLFGTTGEGASISRTERTQVLHAFGTAGIAPTKIVGGVMANAAPDAADQAAEILDAGGRGVLLAPPSYFKGVSDDGLFAWFSDVLEKLGGKARGIILYNIPSVTAVELPIELIGRLRRAFPNAVSGVKDSSGNWAYTQALLAQHKDLAILIGDERSLAAGVRLGAEGAISGMANICPERLVPMIQGGRDDGGLVDLVGEVLQYPVTPAVKTLVAHRHGDPAWARVRAPLVSTPAAGVASICAAFDKLSAAAAA